MPEAARRAASIESHAEALADLRALESYLSELSDADLADHYDLWAYEEYLLNETGSDIIARAIEIRKKLGDPEKLGESLLSRSRISWVGSDRGSAVKYAREAVDVLLAVGGEALAMAYSTLSTCDAR